MISHPHAVESDDQTAVCQPTKLSVRKPVELVPKAQCGDFKAALFPETRYFWIFSNIFEKKLF